MLGVVSLNLKTKVFYVLEFFSVEFIASGPEPIFRGKFFMPDRYFDFHLTDLFDNNGP